MIEILSLYQQIPVKEKETFKRLTATLECKKNDFLLFDGEVQEELYLIREGIAYMYDDTQVKPVVIDFAYNNRFCVDFNSFLNQVPASYCIQSLSDCRIDQISYKDLKEVFNQSDSIERAFRVLIDKAFIASIRRIQEWRLSIAERFKSIMHRKPDLFRLVPHKLLASYLHIDETNFSKLYNKYCVNSGFIFE